MAKRVVENVNVEMNDEMMSMKIGEKEVKSLVEKLPDWGKEIRKMMAKKYRGYKFWRDGIRIDGDFYMMRKEGDRQWFLKYIHYRICGKGKRTRYRTELRDAYFVDSLGRMGKYENENVGGKDFKYYRIVFYSCNGAIKMSSGAGDVIEALKYSNLINRFQEMDCIRRYEYNNFVNDEQIMEWFSLEELWKSAVMCVRFPKVEFIYKMEYKALRDDLIRRLVDLFEMEEFQELIDWINIIRLCVKHKFHLFENDGGIKYDAYYYGIWWDYIKGLKILGKDWRNPHYLCPDNINDAHDKVIRQLWKKFPEMSVEVKDQKKFDKLKRRYVGMMFEEGDLTIMTLDSPKAYIEESRAMHNCIEGCKYYLKSTSLILCARLKGKRIADIELSLKNYRIIQCCGPFNRLVPERNEISALIEKNIPEIQARQFIRKKKKLNSTAA